MSDDYTPTTEQVRLVFGSDSTGMLLDDRVAAFDRWTRSEREKQARFWMRVTKDYHWLWTGTVDTNGYGRVIIDGRNMAAHRVAYEWLVGPIPEGLELDHLCKVRHCVNPAHLEPVTHKENTARGDTITARASAKTHCPRGHVLAGENLVPSSLRNGRRDCLACSRLRAAEYRKRKRANDA